MIGDGTVTRPALVRLPRIILSATYAPRCAFRSIVSTHVDVAAQHALYMSHEAPLQQVPCAEFHRLGHRILQTLRLCIYESGKTTSQKALVSSISFPGESDQPWVGISAV